MWPHSIGKGPAAYLEEAPSSLVQSRFESQLLAFLRRHEMKLSLDDSQVQVLFEISDEYRSRWAAIEQMRNDKLVLDWKRRQILMESIEKQLNALRESLQKRSSDLRFANTALLAKSTARRLSQFQTKLKGKFSLVKQHQRLSEAMFKALTLKALRTEYVGHLDYFIQESMSAEFPQQGQRDTILAGAMLAAGFFFPQDDRADLVQRIAMARSRATRSIEELFLDVDDGPVFQTKPSKHRI